jgi:ribose 5-phosphate isomerase A
LREAARINAVREALKEIHDGQVVGLGSGSTVTLIVGELARLGLRIKVIPASSQTLIDAVNHKLDVACPESYPSPDVYLDSFDQVDSGGNVIKGGGGAHLREKVLSNSSKRVILVGDYGKRSEVLSRPVPLEVSPFALSYVLAKVAELGGRPTVRMSQGKNGPVVSDNGNYIVDADFGEVRDPERLERMLRNIPGLLENGLFIRPADMIIIGEITGEVSKFTYSRRRI